MLVYMFLSKVATLTQSNSSSATFSCVHFCFTTGLELGIAIFAGIAIYIYIPVTVMHTAIQNFVFTSPVSERFTRQLVTNTRH